MANPMAPAAALAAQFDDEWLPEWRAKAEQAMKRFDAQRTALIDAMPMPRQDLINQVQAIRNEQLQWLAGQHLSAGALTTATELLKKHVQKELVLLERANGRWIERMANDSGFTGCAMLVILRDLGEARAREAAVEWGEDKEANLRVWFENARASVFSRLRNLTDGVRDERELQKAEGIVEAEALQAWHHIQEYYLERREQEAQVAQAAQAQQQAAKQHVAQTPVAMAAAQGPAAVAPVAPYQQATAFMPSFAGSPDINGSMVVDGARARARKDEGKGLGRFGRFVPRGIGLSPGSLFSPSSSPRKVAKKEKSQTEGASSGDGERRSSAHGAPSTASAKPASMAAADSQPATITNDKGATSPTIGKESDGQSDSKKGATSASAPVDPTPCTGRGGGTKGSSSFSGPLHRQPAGTVDSKGSVSTGSGYTIDRNGRWHDSRGRYCKAF